MKTCAFTVALLLVTSTAFAQLSKDEVTRFNEAATILSSLRTPETGIPANIFNKAECVIVIPSLKKAAFIVGGEYGSGVMSCRSGDAWSAPVFMQLAKGSWGFQIGAEEIDLVLTVMNRRGLEKLLSNKVSLGADMSIAAGPVGRNAAASTDGNVTAEMLSYSRAHGIFAGVDLSGGVLRPDQEALARAYGSGVAAADVVMGKTHVRAPAAARPFLAALRREAATTAG